MTQRYEVSDEARAEALGSVFYEIQQLWASSHLIGESPMVMNAFLESMLVHVRVLLDFFERSKRTTRKVGSDRVENDDVLSIDYGFLARRVEINEQYRSRLNKDLAHLSYSRNDRRLPDERKWSRQGVVRPLIERCIDFINFLGDDRLCDSKGVSVADWHRLRDDLVRLRANIAGIVTDI